MVVSLGLIMGMVVFSDFLNEKKEVVCIYNLRFSFAKKRWNFIEFYRIERRREDARSFLFSLRFLHSQLLQIILREQLYYLERKTDYLIFKTLHPNFFNCKKRNLSSNI